MYLFKPAYLSMKQEHWCWLMCPFPIMISDGSSMYLWSLDAAEKGSSILNEWGCRLAMTNFYHPFWNDVEKEQITKLGASKLIQITNLNLLTPWSFRNNIKSLFDTFTRISFILYDFVNFSARTFPGLWVICVAWSPLTQIKPQKWMRNTFFIGPGEIQWNACVIVANPMSHLMAFFILVQDT